MLSRLISFFFSSSSSSPSPSNEESSRVCVASLAFPSSSEMTCNAYQLCFAAPLSVDVESPPVQFRLCNASASHERSFTVSVLPDALRYVVCLLEPQHGVLRAGGDVLVRFSLKLLCTTRVDVPVDVCVDGQFARCRVIVDAVSSASERLDPDRVELLDRDRPLGAGGYGTVYRAKYAAQVIAAKVINEQNALHMSDEQVRRFEHEVTLLARVRHECIVHFIGASHFPGRFMICTELLPLGAVGDLIESAAPPSLALCRRFAIDLARALVYLHQQPIIYRDVKSDNLLACSLDVDAPVNCKLIDFGIARSVKSASKARRYTTRFGSIPYMAPEVIDDQPYCARVDVYAAGIVMAELVMRRHAWHDANLWQLPSRVMNGARPTMPPTTPRAWAQLAQACWAPAPADRPTAAQLLESLCAMQGLFN
jgi:hypothetical protein